MKAGKGRKQFCDLACRSERTTGSGSFPAIAVFAEAKRSGSNSVAQRRARTQTGSGSNPAARCGKRVRGRFSASRTTVSESARMSPNQIICQDLIRRYGPVPRRKLWERRETVSVAASAAKERAEAIPLDAERATQDSGSACRDAGLATTGSGDACGGGASHRRIEDAGKGSDSLHASGAARSCDKYRVKPVRAAGSQNRAC